MAHRKLAILRRRVFTALSVLSLLLCVATLALWGRSYRYVDRVRWIGIYETTHQYFALESHRGLCALRSSRQDNRGLPIPENPGWAYLTARTGDPLSFLPKERFLGFGYVHVGRINRTVWLPHWSLALLFAILPALHLRAAIRLRRLNRIGHCPRCGYDLRATPERCPECGHTIQPLRDTESTESTEIG